MSGLDLLLSVPDDISVPLLVNWLDVIDLARLDTALCAKIPRVRFLEILALEIMVLRRPNPLDLRTSSWAYMEWISKRKVHITELHLRVGEECSIGTQNLLRDLLKWTGPLVDKLNLSGSFVHNDVLRMLAMNCIQLREVYVHNASDAFMMALGENCPHLQVIDFSRSRFVTDAGLRSLTDGCRQLKHISTGGAISDCGMQRMITNCSAHLHTLDIRASIYITLNEGIRPLIEQCPPALRVLLVDEDIMDEDDDEDGDEVIAPTDWHAIAPLLTIRF